MSGSVNKVILIGNICQEIEVRTMQSGDKVATFSIATNERWKDRQSGERKEKAEFHRVVVFSQPLVTLCENYMKKGSKVYLEGQLETRSWESNGKKKYTTEIVLRPFKGEITMLDSKTEAPMDSPMSAPAGEPTGGHMGDMEDTIPFNRVDTRAF